MDYIDARLLATAVKPEQYPDTFVPEIAFAGRSNVRKSSLKLSCQQVKTRKDKQLARKNGNN